MMYLAPRQGMFAIIVLVSFCLQTLLLVVSTDQQLTKSSQQKGEQMVAQLIDEARLSLENKDRVSLSVIANRYTSEQDVARLVIKDNNDDILVPVGNAPMQEGVTISQIATKGDAVIGSVALTLKDISKGEIIAMQWPFVIGSLFFHLLLWLIYGYIARPTKAQINALSRDIQTVHHQQSMQAATLAYGQQATDFSAVDHDNGFNGDGSNHDSNNDRYSANRNAANKTAPITATGIHGDVNAYLRAQQSAGNAKVSADSVVSADSTDNSDKTTHTDSAQAQTDTQVQSAKTAANSHAKLSGNRAFDSVSVQIAFHDEYNMLNLLAPEMRMPYMALCTQLLKQALTELLQQPLLMGVSALNEPSFEDKGATVVLKADNSHAKVALAGVMLGKLYLMLNKIIYDKHNELSRFALPVKAGVSDIAQADAMTQLLGSVGKKEQLLILLPNAGLKQIGNHVQVLSLNRPTTVYERECALFDGGSDAMIQRLAEVRNAVLMTGNEDE